MNMALLRSKVSVRRGFQLVRHRPFSASVVNEQEKTKPKITKDALLRLVDLSRDEWHLIGMSAGTLGLTSTITLFIPYASGQVIDITINDSGASPTVLAAGLFGLTAVAGGGVYLRSLWLARAGNRIVARLKQKLYASLLRQDSAFLAKQNTGDLLSRLSSDTQMVQSALTSQAVSALRATIMTIGSASMLLYTSPTLAVLSCCTLPPIFVATRHVGQKLREQQTKVQELKGESTNLAEQAVGHYATVKHFCAEGFETTRYHNKVAEAHRRAVETAHMQAQLEALAHVSANGAILGVLGYGGNLVLDGTITAGDLGSFVMYSLLMAGNVSSISSLYGDLVRTMAASQRVFDIMDQVPRIERRYELGEAVADPLLHIEGESVSQSRRHLSPASVELRDVRFSYPSRPDVPVLRDFSLKLEPGEHVALVGISGSGKSTVASLLTRMYDSDNAGSILLNGTPLSQMDTTELRQIIGIVSQDAAILQGTIRENLMYGSWYASEAQVLEVAHQAHVMEFANQLPAGLDTVVGPRGSQLSGGQRQRIAIGRVLLKDPPFIILDEASSALDAKSERIIHDTIEAVSKDRTVLSIAHRLSTIRQADRIAVMQGGKIVQDGSFNELSIQTGPFQDLVRSQLFVDEQS